MQGHTALCACCVARRWGASRSLRGSPRRFGAASKFLEIPTAHHYFPFMCIFHGEYGVLFLPVGVDWMRHVPGGHKSKASIAIFGVCTQVQNVVLVHKTGSGGPARLGGHAKVLGIKTFMDSCQGTVSPLLGVGATSII